MLVVSHPRGLSKYGAERVSRVCQHLILIGLATLAIDGQASFAIELEPMPSTLQLVAKIGQASRQFPGAVRERIDRCPDGNEVADAILVKAKLSFFPRRFDPFGPASPRS
ncbi:MAG: hypothetical protein KIS86_18030, partial [Devosia sp.]|nr:hypothetical protein [Devosia sp.]